MFIPEPINTADVVLPDEMTELMELIAKNVHNTWAAGRIADGWTYGPVKDGVKKETPLLVPYEELDENEKKYDRDTAIGTLKLIISLGYTIRKE